MKATQGSLNNAVMQNELRNQRQLTEIAQYAIWDLRGDILRQPFA